MTGLLVLLALFGVCLALVAALGRLTWRWKPPIGRHIVQASSLLTAALLIYACGDLFGIWFHVSRSEAEDEFEDVLGFDVPPVERVTNTTDLGWAPTDGPHYGYTVTFAPTEFEAFMAAWRLRSDSSSLLLYDSLDTITHEFSISSGRRTVRYFHADE